MAGTVTSNLTLVDAADAVTGWVSGTGALASTAIVESGTAALYRQNSLCLKINAGTTVGFFSQVVPVTAVNLTGATLYCWHNFQSTYILQTLANGGIRIRVADSTSPGVNWGEWFVGGKDVYGNFQGNTAATRQSGWTCFAIDCDRPYDAQSVTPPNKAAITFIGVGSAISATDPSGNALDIWYWDVIRHDNRLGLGGGLTITGGTTASPATFQDFYDADKAAANAYGIVRKTVGSFALQGPLTIGSATQTAVTTFTDSGQIVLWDDAQVKNSGIYGITLKGAASFLTTVTFGNFVSGVASKGVSILSPGNSLYTILAASGGKNPTGYGSLSTTAPSTITRTVGDWTKDGYVAGATVTTAGFTNAANNGTFHIVSATATALTISETTLVTEAGATTRTVDGVNVMRWDLVINANSALKAYASRFEKMGRGTITSTSEFRSCTFSNFGDITPAGATIDNCTFQDVYTFAPISGTYALVLNAASDATPITNCKFINCNKAIRITAAGTYAFNNWTFSGNTFDVENTSLGAVTINVSGGGSTPTVLNTGAGSTTTVVNAVTVKVTCFDAKALTTIQNARVFLTADTGGPLPYQVSVTITRTGSTATVTHTAHGRKVGEKMLIKGADQQEYNGIQTITAVTTNTYDYTVSGTPATPATGTITSTMVILSGLTDASGVIQDTGFNYPGVQPVRGRARKGTATPFYATAPIIGSITTAGLTVSAFLVPDA